MYDQIRKEQAKMPFKPKLNKVSKALGELKKQQAKMFK